MGVEVRCALCGKKSELSAEDKDYKKVVEAPKKITYICDMCNHKVRFESEDNVKPKKPI